MALSSPGVEVTIIDQSQYLPAASSSVPLVLVATSQNKANAAGTGVAAATTAANAGKLYQVTSQRDLVNLYGNPFFYKTTNGTSIHGYELNEYGLLAAYSLLGVTNRCYVLRADIDLGALVGTLARPLGNPTDGLYWLDTTNTKWGIYEFNATTGKFVAKNPMVLVDSIYISDDMPKDSVGNIGDYAVIPSQADSNSFSSATYFYKTLSNVWVALGSSEWKMSVPTVKATNAPSSLTAGDSFRVNVSGNYYFDLTVPSAPNNTVGKIAEAINDRNIGNLSAVVEGGLLKIYYGEHDQDRYLQMSPLVGTALDDLGIAETQYFAPEIVFGPSAEMPLWSASQQNPRPSGSVWVKTSTSGGGLDIVLSKYSATTDSYRSIPVSKYPAELYAIADLDPAGGKNIPAGTVFAAIGGTNVDNGPVFYVRRQTGATTVVSSVLAPETTIGKVLNIAVSIPGTSATVSDQYQLTITEDGSTGHGSAETFVRDWQQLQIPNTTATVLMDGSIQLSHTAGGEIWFNDYVNGQSNGLLSELGFAYGVGASTGVRKTIRMSYANASVSQIDTSGDGTGAVLSITNYKDGSYKINSVVSGGSNYAVGDTLRFAGSDLGGGSGNDLIVSVQKLNNLATSIQDVAIVSGTPYQLYSTALSNWDELSYTPNEGAPSALPSNGTNWFYSTATQVDIMVKKGTEWIGYRNTAYDNTGHPSSTGVANTDPTGVITSATAPTTQTDGTSLEYGDLWLDTSDLENYPMIYRWEDVDMIPNWVLIDKTDQTSSNGLLFADARWASNAGVDPVSDPIPSIAGLLTSNYVDLDAPDAALYPQGMLLFNTRRSGYNVKQFVRDKFTSSTYPDAGAVTGDATVGNLPLYTYTWVSVSGLAPDGSAYMGRKAQRALVVQSLKAAIATNMTIREEDNFFNLVAAPGYPELQPDMIALNNERNQTAFIVGDTPLRLPDQATAITNWATNANGATSSGEEGWVTRNTYLGVFYPSGITTDLTGASVVVPASHMMLRTFLRNDTIAYPWLAAAGTRRGTIDNCTNIGYLDANTGEFVTVKNRMSLRDVMYTNQINPLAYFTGVGLLNYGNKTSYDSQSALDRINVARLVAYIRERLQVAARPFVFEPNDALTRSQLAGVVQSLFIDLVAKRGLYDYLVVCDETNNTPSRIDRNELWVDVAIEPVKAAEFIYIPVRIMNTGALSA